MIENTTVPSPVPPWHRNTQSPQVQTLYEGGAISLTMDVTYLDQTVPNPQDGPYLCTLPDGSYRRQTKRIFVKKQNENTTAQFRVTGTFVGLTSLLFTPIAYNAVLEWDGAGWHLVGGNAEVEQ